MSSFNKPLSTQDTVTMLASNDASIVTNTLLHITFSHPNWQWVQNQCIQLTKHANADIASLAVCCIGHLARIHGTIHIQLVIPLLTSIAQAKDSELAGRAEDALADIQQFVIHLK